MYIYKVVQEQERNMYSMWRGRVEKGNLTPHCQSSINFHIHLSYLSKQKNSITIEIMLLSMGAIIICKHSCCQQILCCFVQPIRPSTLRMTDTDHVYL